MDSIAFQVVRSGNVSLLRRLLDTSPDVLGARDGANSTLLHVAALEGHAEICSEIIARDPCSILAIDDAGASPHDLAGSATVATLLLAVSAASSPSTSYITLRGQSQREVT